MTDTTGLISKREKPILALDLGTVTGWACKLNSGVYSGTETFRPGRFEGGGMRYLRFANWLSQDCVSPSAIYFEEVRRHAATDAAHVYGGFLATLTRWCEEHSVPYQGVPVGTIKKYACGRGNANKQAMIDAMKARGFAPEDDNEADALAILLWATQGKQVAA